MAFTAKDVKELREMTGVGMMDCKKALVASDGDKDKAIDWLREKGLAAAKKKAGRVAAEGIAYADVIGSTGVVVEVNAETDFVAQNEKFVEFVKDVAKAVAENAPADVEALLDSTYSGSARRSGTCSRIWCSSSARTSPCAALCVTRKVSASRTFTQAAKSALW